MASLYICLYCTILTTLTSHLSTWLACWSISRWCCLQSTALAGFSLCSRNAKTCKCIFPILWHTSLSNKIFWWIVVEVLSERLCWMSKRQFKRKYDILRHDLYSTMWSNVLLSHRRWQIWWKMQHGLERAANNNNKQTQHKWNLEKSDTSYYVDSWTLYTCDKKTTVSTNIRHNLSSLVPVSTYFNWAHTWTWSRLLPELTLIFGFCICQLAVHEK